MMKLKKHCRLMKQSLEGGEKPEVLDELLASKDGDGYALICCLW
jgi:hypothetical protein